MARGLSFVAPFQLASKVEGYGKVVKALAQQSGPISTLQNKTGRTEP
jgi:hypothetical protein